jgi:DNA-binding transcriptional MerR regulator
MSTPDPERKVDPPCYRSGAAARLAKMPVTTLRIWERRYGVVSPPKTPSGQRLYSAEDVRRLILLKKLVERGHAIGSIARLDLDQLDRLSLTYSESAFARQPADGQHEARIAIVGMSLARRLRGELPQLQSASPPRLTMFDDLHDARQYPFNADALLINVASLQDDTMEAILGLAERCRARLVAVVYAFGTGHCVDGLRHAGVRVHREPFDKNDMLQLLRDLSSHGLRERVDEPSRVPRRYPDEALAAIATRSTTIACECPRHLSDLIRQLSAFEQYSDDCESRTPVDAALHRYLGDVANRARAMVELALERVAREEQWPTDER